VRASVELPAARCPSCDTAWGPGLLSCPGCQRLVHAQRLAALASEAAQATRDGRVSEALAAWRVALELLPPTTQQAAEVAARVEQLSARAGVQPLPPASGQQTKKRGLAAVIGAAALGLWKFKFVALALLGKGKLLLLGLTKLPTLLSMFFAFGAYWSLWGWPFALGFVLSIYVHEMGHVFALRRYGISASAPMFVPGLGAFVRLNQRPANAREDAAVGLAGPWWGVSAGVAFAAIGAATGRPIFFALAHVTALINLFNLMPVWQLDGARGFTALSRAQRGWCAVALGAGWYLTGETTLVLVMLVAAFRVFDGTAATEGHRPTLVSFVALVVLLTGLTALGGQSAP
jgi:Zn-dependent protease